MSVKKMVIFLLVLISLITAGFVIAEIKDGYNIKRVEAQSVGRNILYVGGSGPNNYTKIQDAIDNASDGDTVFVYNGTYYENVVVDKSITLIGENKETTIIDGGGSGDVVCISADNVNISYFTVQNSGSYWYDRGIELGNVQHCCIENTIITNNNDDGIWLSSSSNNSISGNTINNNNGDGIWLYYFSNNNIISGNTINNNNGDGIGLYYFSNNNIISGNTINNNNDDGIWLCYSSNNNISSNTMVKNGIVVRGGELSYWNTHNIYDNTVNGKPLYYLKNVNGGTVPDGAGQIILANCTNIIIENQNVSNASVGIEMGFSTGCTIINTTASNNNFRSIYLEYSSNNSINGNTISNNNDDGIWLYSSSNNNISSNTISNNEYGIMLPCSSNNNIISGNTINNNNDGGIGLYCSSNNNIISGNTINNNNDDGIFLGSSSNNNISSNTISNNEYGIMLYCSSNNNIISGNTINNNNDDGIFLGSSSNNNIISGNTINNNDDGIGLNYSSNNIISGNTINNNNYYGIRLLYFSNNNLLYHNNFLNNNHNAYDEYSNSWDNGQEGNYWDDYSGSDNNGDGIGDMPYYIPGGDNKDNYPLMYPWVPTYPDLTLCSYDIEFSKPYIREGAIVTICATIHNTGNASATNVTVKFFEKVNDHWIQIGTNQTISNISFDGYANVSVIWIPTFGGIRSIKVVVDPDDAIYEENENNNEAIKSVSVQQIIRLLPSVDYNKTSKMADITVWAFNTLTGNVTTGNGTWKIYHNGNFTGISGNLMYNVSSHYWESRNINLSALDIGYYSVKINISTGNMSGEGEISLAILSGFCTIRGIVKEKVSGDPIENANVTLYLFGFLQISSITTNASGAYSFDFILPGIYRLHVSKEPYIQTYEWVFIPSDVIRYINFSLKTTGEEITVMMDNLYNQSRDSLEHLADKMGYITETYPNLVGDDVDAMGILSFAGDVATIAIAPEQAVTAGMATQGKTAFYAVWGVLAKRVRQEIINEIIEESASHVTKTALDQIVLLFTSSILPDADEIKNTSFYTGIEQFLASVHNDFDNGIKNISVSPDFDEEMAHLVISSEIKQFKNIGEAKIIIMSIDPSHPYRYFVFPASYDAYIAAKTALEALGLTENILIVVQIGAFIGGVAAIIATGGAAAPAVIPILQGVSTAKKVVEAAELAAKIGVAMAFVDASLSWMIDSSSIPILYNQTASMMKTEVSSPYYLNKSNSFTAELNVDINEDADLFGIKFLWVPFFADIKTADVTVENTGNNSWIRMIAEGFEGRKYMTHGEIQDWTVPFLVNHFPVVDLFRDKWFKADVYSGVNPYPVDHFEARYRTTAVRWWWREGNRDDAPDFKASTSRGTLTLSDYYRYSSRTSKILDVNLTTQNYSIETNYTVANNSTGVEFVMFYPSNARVELHVYDMQGHHVGFDYALWNKSIGFPADYSGVGSNPQVVNIPGSTGKTFHIVAQLSMAISENETYHVTLYASETPFRPAVMSVEPGEIITVGNINQTISIPFFCGEAGMQHSLYNVTIEISNISNGNMSLQFLTPQNYVVDTILAGSVAQLPIKIFTPQNIPEGNYTGKIIVNASNADKVTINITVILDITSPTVIPNPTIYPSGQQSANINETVTFNVTVYDITNLVSVSVNVSAISSVGFVTLFANGNSSYYIGNITIDKNVSDGIYYLPVTAMDAAGNINDTMNVSVRIGNFPPIANFSYYPQNPTIFDVIHFTDLSKDTDGYIVNWTWNFGDRNISYEQNPSHQYANVGIYNVTLTVRDDDGATASITKQIIVVSIDYILVTHKNKNEIKNCNISTNFSFIAYASAFNNTYGFIDLIDANWSIVNYASNASINATHGKSILFNSGWNDGTAILTAEYNGHNDSVVFNINSSLFSFMLYKGWNLITLPCENSYNASSLFNDIEGCSIILGWNANVQDFIIYVPGSPYDFAIENGKGYFIGMSHDSIFSLVDIPVQNVSVHLYIGWNILGWFNSWQTNASSLYNAIQGCTLVLKWNASMQDFDLYAPGVPNDFVIARGEGFLVAVDEESEWHGEG